MICTPSIFSIDGLEEIKLNNCFGSISKDTNRNNIEFRSSADKESFYDSIIYCCAHLIAIFQNEKLGNVRTYSVPFIKEAIGAMIFSRSDKYDKKEIQSKEAQSEVSSDDNTADDNHTVAKNSFCNHGLINKDRYS